MRPLELGKEAGGRGAAKKILPGRSWNVYENKRKIDTMSEKMSDIVPDFARFQVTFCLIARKRRDIFA